MVGPNAAGTITPGTALSVATRSLPDGRKGHEYTAALALNAKRPVPANWTAYGLPPGLTLNRVTGTLTGKPSADGSFGVVVVAIARHGDGTASASYTLKVSK